MTEWWYRTNNNVKKIVITLKDVSFKFKILFPIFFITSVFFGCEARNVASRPWFMVVKMNFWVHNRDLWLWTTIYEFKTKINGCEQRINGSQPLSLAMNINFVVIDKDFCSWTEKYLFKTVIYGKHWFWNSWTVINRVKLVKLVCDCDQWL